MSELGTYQGASTIMRKTLDWKIPPESNFGLLLSSPNILTVTHFQTICLLCFAGSLVILSGINYSYDNMFVLVGAIFVSLISVARHVDRLF
jgi:hypothetical protein